MKILLRIALFVGSIFVIKPSGRAVMLVFISETSHSFLSVVTMVVFFVIGTLALFVAFGERHFSNAWLMPSAAVGLCAVALGKWSASCSEVQSDDLSYNAFYCSHPEMTWAMGGICVALALIVVLREFASARAG